MGGGGTKTVQSTENTSPWGPQQPFLVRGFDRAEDVYNSGNPTYYPGQTVADTTAATTQGQAGALQASGQNARDIGFTAGGGYLDSGNPHFQQMVGRIGEAIRPGIDSAFAGTGRLGSGAHAQAFASALADKSGSLAFQNYGDERGRQTAAQQDYSPFATMFGVGGQQEAKQGQYLGDMAARWDFDQNRDANRLAQYMAQIKGQYGGTNISSKPYTGGDPFLQAFGTGLAGVGALGQGIPGLMSLFK